MAHTYVDGVDRAASRRRLTIGRTAVLSRLLAPTEFGTTVALSVLVATAGLVTDMAIDKFVMANFDDHRALSAAHMISLVRGVLLACVIVVIAPSIAASFGVPQFAGSFALVAVVPFISGFAHLGNKQVEGAYNYGPEMRTQLISQLTAFFAVVFACYMMVPPPCGGQSVFDIESEFTPLPRMCWRAPRTACGSLVELRSRLYWTSAFH